MKLPWIRRKEEEEIIRRLRGYTIHEVARKIISEYNKKTRWRRLWYLLENPFSKVVILHVKPDNWLLIRNDIIRDCGWEVEDFEREILLHILDRGIREYLTHTWILTP